MTKHTQFLRKATLLVGNATDGIDLSNLQFSFAIKQADMESPQSATVRIYNVAGSTAQTIKANEYTRIIIQAGYQQGSFGVIFDGEIIQARLGRQSAVDTYMDILAAEGYSANQATINVTLAAGATMLDAAQAAASAMGVTLVNHLTDTPPKLPRGTSMYGMARDVMHKAAASLGASWYFSGDKVELVPLANPKPGAVTVMNANTGMIGWPEQTQDGIKLKCLLNPMLEVASALQIDNASILAAQPSTSYQFVNNYPKLDADGLYKIYVIEHHGDTRGTDWYSDIVCLSIDPANSGLTGLVQKGQF